ncbi:hypothetical protein AX774_g6014, partial [Zancudomyces culisetae]
MYMSIIRTGLRPQLEVGNGLRNVVGSKRLIKTGFGKFRESEALANEQKKPEEGEGEKNRFDIEEGELEGLGNHRQQHPDNSFGYEFQGGYKPKEKRETFGYPQQANNSERQTQWNNRPKYENREFKGYNMGQQNRNRGNERSSGLGWQGENRTGQGQGQGQGQVRAGSGFDLQNTFREKIGSSGGNFRGFEARGESVGPKVWTPKNDRWEDQSRTGGDRRAGAGAASTYNNFQPGPRFGQARPGGGGGKTRINKVAQTDLLNVTLEETGEEKKWGAERAKGGKTGYDSSKKTVVTERREKNVEQIKTKLKISDEKLNKLENELEDESNSTEEYLKIRNKEIRRILSRSQFSGPKRGSKIDLPLVIRVE